jgi:hypothetical protein
MIIPYPAAGTPERMWFTLCRPTLRRGKLILGLFLAERKDCPAKKEIVLAAGFLLYENIILRI